MQPTPNPVEAMPLNTPQALPPLAPEKIVRLNKDAHRRLIAGHLWIYSNEIDTRTASLKSYSVGELVRVETANGAPLGIGYINPHNLLCIRLLTIDPRQPIDLAFFVNRLTQAEAKRKLMFDQPYYRVVYGDSDLLPGVVMDRFGDTLVIQINTAGMEHLKAYLIAAASQVFTPKNILIKNDSTERKNENLDTYAEIVQGSMPSECVITENNCTYEIPLVDGQKTGWFYDHRYNRERIASYAPGKRVLDVFSYTGAFGIPCAKAGATEVLCVDSSAKALALLDKNAARNQLKNIQTRQEDALACLHKLHAEGKQFDVVILDPPALIKAKKDIPAGSKMYQKLNEAALALVSKQGVLLSASCSMHLSGSDLLNICRKAGLSSGRQLSVLEQCHQAPDHPVHPAIAETNYLKGFIFSVQTA